ncbi:hypothetical protein CYY_001077 [Polysphondylium violaceum]|uniref:Phosphatidylinositol N-acetylglucosaminyltransferase subunit H conserved domain-containing protein n=1 Tax=Polysphondylium violaceum TaxID=133409 RepID=A0A8J4Q2G5_9MYCE|nr:hypothetical protein CYY_001077 [Polysphondylium violaceum]
MEYNCIHINNDVKEYRISRKDKSIVTKFDYFLLSLLLLTALYHHIYLEASALRSFSTYLIIFLIIFKFYLKLFIVKEESLIVMRELGVQIKRKYFLRPDTLEFIDKNKIQNVIINEGITKHNVIFYMAFIVEGKNKMVLAFEDLIPRLNILLQIYRGTLSVIK